MSHPLMYCISVLESEVEFVRDVYATLQADYGRLSSEEVVSRDSQLQALRRGIDLISDAIKKDSEETT